MNKLFLCLILTSAFVFAANTVTQTNSTVKIPAKTTNNTEKQTEPVPLDASNVKIALASIVANANSRLPRRLDYVTVLDRVVLRDKQVSYYYILNDDEDFKLTKFRKSEKDKFLKDIQNNLKKGFCSSNEIKNLMKFGATFAYNFEVKNTGLKYFNFKFNENTCK